MNTKDRRYIYFRKDINNNTTGTICVGYSIDFDKKIVALATSVCMPKVDRFSKREAHNKLEDRLTSPDTYALKYEGDTPTYKDMVFVVRELLSDVATNKLNIPTIVLPSWAKSYIKQGFPVTQKIINAKLNQ